MTSRTTSQRITSPAPTYRRNANNRLQSTGTRRNGWRLVHTKKTVSASHWFPCATSVDRFFLRCIIFSSWDFRPSLVRAALAQDIWFLMSHFIWLDWISDTDTYIVPEWSWYKFWMAPMDKELAKILAPKANSKIRDADMLKSSCQTAAAKDDENVRPFEICVCTILLFGGQNNNLTSKWDVLKIHWSFWRWCFFSPKPLWNARKCWSTVD